MILSFQKSNAALQGHWTLDETSGNAIDETGGTNGVITGATQGVAGKIGNAYSFDGTNDYVSMAGFSWSTAQQDVTVSFWNYVASADVQNSWSFSVGGSSGDDRFSSHSPWSNNEVYFDYDLCCGNGRVNTTGAAYSAYDDKWTLVTLVSDGNSGTFKGIYLDGILAVSGGTSDGPDNNLSGLTLGHNPGVGVGTDHHHGEIDDFAIYDEMLSGDEIKVLYDLGNSGTFNYNVSEFDSIKQIHDAGSGSTLVDGQRWFYKSSLTESEGLTTSGTKHTLVFNDTANTGLTSFGDFYWDLHNNNAGASSGTTATGTWDTSTSNWNVNSDGSGANETWTDGSTAHFSAGSDATGASTVTVSGTQTVGGLYFEEGTVTITGGTALDLGTSSVTIDVASGRTANIETALNGSGGILKTGDGTLNVKGNLNNTGDIVITGGKFDRNGTGANGDLEIADGAGENQAVTITSGAELELNDELFMGGSSTSTATLVATGSGSTVDVGDEVFIASSASSVANVTIASGADLIAGNTVRIGQRGTGAVTVTGSGSSFTVSSNKLSVGGSDTANANGLLRIENGALLVHTAGSTFEVGEHADSIGSVVITGAGTTALLETVNVGEVSNEDNQFVVSNSAVTTFTADLTMGKDANSNGSVTIVSGANVSVAGEIYTGLNGTGSLTITGSGTTVTLSKATDEVFNVGDNSGGNGYLEVSGGAYLETTHVSANLQIGTDAGSLGSALISGAGTTAIVGDLLVGRASANDNKMVVSNTANLTVKEELYLGWAASAKGIMTIESGADVSVANIVYIGDSGSGILTVDGSGSTLSATTVLVGDGAGSQGTLTLSNGGTIDATTVTVQQTGSSFTADTIAIGNAAAEIDTLNIESGATASATTIDIGSGGNLNLNRSDGITGSSNMLLSGGTFTTNGNDQAVGGLGNLTMTANSVIDMGAGAILNFAALDETTWTGTLSIHFWSSGKHNGSGSDQLIFADHVGFLQSTHGLQIKFYSDGGTTLVGSSGYFIGNALVAAPEPGTWIGIVSLGIFGIYFEFRRRGRLSRRRQSTSRLVEL